MLEGAEHSFEELREVMGLPVAVLEEDLRHLDRSVRVDHKRLRVEPSRCRECGFRLKVRPGRFATPSRCPRCRSERLEPPRLQVG